MTSAHASARTWDRLPRLANLRLRAPHGRKATSASYLRFFRPFCNRSKWILAVLSQQTVANSAFSCTKICQFGKKSYLCIAFEKKRLILHRGVEQLVARQAHNLEVVRSSRAPATKLRQVADATCFFLLSRCEAGTFSGTDRPHTTTSLGLIGFDSGMRWYVSMQSVVGWLLNPSSQRIIWRKQICSRCLIEV